MKTWCLFLVTLMVGWMDVAAATAQIQVGAALRVMTPDPLLPVSGGMGPTEPAQQKRGELTVRAIVISSPDTTIAIVSLDLLGFPGVLGDRVRRLVPSIPSENIVIGATHTHSAPDCYAFPDGQGGHTGDLAFMDRVCHLAAEAIQEAGAKRVPARLKVATGAARGKIAYNYYAPDLYDSRVSVLQFIGAADATATPTDQVLATLVNYAIHPEVIGASQGIVSPDLIGPLCERIEARTGGMALFMNGAQGGMITADNRDLNQPSDSQRAYWKDVQTWEECQRIGHALADESLRLIGEAAAQESPRLTCRSRLVEFPVSSDAMWAVVCHSPLNYPRNDANRSITTRLQLIELGNAQIATIPGEALPNIGFYLKRKMSGEHNLLFGLTNDAFGYILTKVDFLSFPRYEYVSRVSLGEMTGEILIENVLGLVEETR